MNWYRMITMPAVYRTFDLVPGYGRYYGPWCLRVMGLAWGILVEGTKIYNTAWTAVRLGSNYHALAPGYWVIHRNSF